MSRTSSYDRGWEDDDYDHDDYDRRDYRDPGDGGGEVLDVEGWLSLLSVHGPEPRAGTCVHADAVGYGTRSSFVLHRARTAASSRCAWTEARPCTTPARDGTALLRTVGRW